MGCQGNKKSFCANVWNKLLVFSNKDLLLRGDKILAGVSGGPDSVCLLHFLKQVSKRFGFEVIACHINHKLRGKAADADETFTKNLCKKLNVLCFSKKANVKNYAKRHSLSLEHAARKIRYEIFEKIALKNKCNKIATGHHLDDHVETMLINILRGTNPRGLLGIPKIRPLKKGRKKPLLIRPLLCIMRKEVIEYLKQNKLKYKTDKSNENEKFTRNWIRKKLLPDIEKKQPKFREHLLDISQKLETIIR